MILKSDNFYLFLIFASVISSFVFCVGFFPYAAVEEVKIDEVPAKETFGDSKVDKTILMVIDALRLDFIESESFAYLHQLIEKKEACVLKLSVNLPTVTKPRIKVSRMIQLINNLLDSYLSGVDIRHNTKFSRRRYELR